MNLDTKGFFSVLKNKVKPIFLYDHPQSLLGEGVFGGKIYQYAEIKSEPVFLHFSQAKTLPRL